MVPLLNKGTYNCVSSAILYLAVGEQLGIKLIAENAPEHVFLRMGNVSIESTTGYIYYPDERQKNFDKLWAKADPVEKLVFSNKQYQPLDKTGLIGMIYFNRSVLQADITNRQPPRLSRLFAWIRRVRITRTKPGPIFTTG